MPLQVDAAVAVLLMHLAGLQIVPAAYRRQAPLPSQTPSVPQLPVPWSTHLPFGSAVPMATGPQRPADPESLHDEQLEVHALSQQTPSAQKFD